MTDGKNNHRGQPRLAAIILAAGESQRMGGPLKPLLPYRDGTFLTAIIAALRGGGMNEIFVVLGCRAAEVRAALDLSGVTVVENPDWRQGMLTSLRAGVRALPAGVAGALVTLVDLPALAAATVRAVAAAWQEDPARLVVAAHRGRRGHPVIFPGDLFAELLAGDFPDGPRGLRRAHADRERLEAVADPGCLTDIDTPAAYQRLTAAGDPAIPGNP